MPIEGASLPITGGGAVLDIDQDGDMDIVFGTEGGEVWWWENPFPDFNVPWPRHLVTRGGPISRAVLFADLTASGRPQLAFWNQASNTVYWAGIPEDARTRDRWDVKAIFAAPENRLSWTSRLLAVDVDMDSALDLVAGNYWLKRMAEGQFKATRIGNEVGQVAVGRFREGTFPQFVVAPEDGTGVVWYECKAYPDRAISWAGRPVFGFEVGPIATLAIADVDGNESDDLFVGERSRAGSSGARAWIVYSDRKGNFRPREFTGGGGLRDVQFVDMNHDGRPDIIGLTSEAGVLPVQLWMNTECRPGK